MGRESGIESRWSDRGSFEQRDKDMYILIHDAPAPRGLSSPKIPARTRTAITRSEELATESAPAVDHDATLLVAALEVVESRRAAIEWLLEGDLLRVCLV